MVVDVVDVADEEVSTTAVVVEVAVEVAVVVAVVASTLVEVDGVAVEAAPTAGALETSKARSRLLNKSAI